MKYLLISIMLKEKKENMELGIYFRIFSVGVNLQRWRCLNFFLDIISLFCEKYPKVDFNFWLVA